MLPRVCDTTKQLPSTNEATDLLEQHKAIIKQYSEVSLHKQKVIALHRHNVAAQGKAIGEP